MIIDLSGCKIVYINGLVFYVCNVFVVCGFSVFFEKIYGIEYVGYFFKFECIVFEIVFVKDGLDFIKVVMFEDDYCNLKVLYDMGLNIVFVVLEVKDELYFQYYINDFGVFLSQFF